MCLIVSRRLDILLAFEHRRGRGKLGLLSPVGRIDDLCKNWSMTDVLRIKSLKFRAGAREGQPGLQVDTPSVTLIVGPNNSGKSQALREIETWCLGTRAEPIIIEEIELTLPETAEEARAMLVPFETDPPPGQAQQVGQVWFGRPIIRSTEQEYKVQVTEDTLRQWFDGRANDKLYRHLRSIMVRPFVLRLDGRTRFELMDDKPTGPLEVKPANHLWALFVDYARREQVRAFTEAAFGRHFVIDPTGMNVYRARLSERRPADNTEEQALDARSRAFHGSAPLISTLGDGVRASIGLVSAVMSLPHKILLVDEPEAFLHPTLARRMGRTLAEAAKDRDASLVVATHSADLLMGCIQAAPELRLVRLTHQGGESTARSIDTRAVAELMNDPLLRSTSALRALFHRGVVVTEADADRAFYEEINSRLLQTGRGVEDSLFLNAQNWQTILRITKPLRQLGIPAAAVFDFDVLMSNEFAPVWELVKTDQTDLESLQFERAAIKALMETAGRKECKAKGIEALLAKDRARVTAFITRMRTFGIFFVPKGELESWLQALGVARSDKSKWITKIFEQLGADPDDAAYVRPSTDDVWAFIDRIESWIAKPDLPA